MPGFAAALFALLLILAACEAESDTTPSGAPDSASPEGSASATVGAEPTDTQPEPVGPAMTDEALGVEVAASGLTEPTSIGFIGSDEYFVTEKSTGEVHRVQGGEIGEPVLDLAVNFFDERGLLGIAVHPQFADNGHVYLTGPPAARATARRPCSARTPTTSSPCPTWETAWIGSPGTAHS